MLWFTLPLALPLGHLSFGLIPGSPTKRMPDAARASRGPEPQGLSARSCFCSKVRRAGVCFAENCPDGFGGQPPREERCLREAGGAGFAPLFCLLRGRPRGARRQAEEPEGGRSLLEPWLSPPCAGRCVRTKPWN